MPVNLSMTLEIIKRFTGVAGARQAAEVVFIRDEKPKMNGKDAKLFSVDHTGPL